MDFSVLPQVLTTPVDDLVKILGLEVPPAPEVSLLEVTSDSVTIHWKPPEHRHAVARYGVRINGLTVEEIPPYDNAVVIAGLLPNHCYTICIVSLNQASFQAASEAIRVKTLHTGLDDAAISNTLKRKRSPSSSAGGKPRPDPAPAPRVVSYKAFPESLHHLTAAPMARERSGSSPPARRANGSRRSSTAVQSTTHNPTDNFQDSSTIQALTIKLDEVRTQLQEQERLDGEEELEFQRNQSELLARRDSLKRHVKERDEESKDLNKNVKSLEHANSAAQNKRAQQEKTLNEKVRTREKLQEDVARWDGELAALEAETESLVRQKQQLSEAAVKNVQDIREEQKLDAQALNSIEEQIQERGKEVRELEKEKKRLDETSDVADLADRQRAIAAVERECGEKLASLHAQLQSMMASCYQAQAILHQKHQHNVMINGRRGSQSHSFAPNIPVEGHQVLPELQPAPTMQGARVNFDLPDSRLNPPSLQGRNGMPSNTAFRSSSPFASGGQSLGLQGWSQSQSGAPPTEADIEALTGGSLVSPSAGGLLPSDLLGDDNDDVGPQPRDRPAPLDVSMGSRPASMVSRTGGTHFNRNSRNSSGEAEYLPGLGNIPGLGSAEVYNSPNSPAPGSLNSASPSIISSPRSSNANLHQQKASDQSTESDRRSTRSASGSSRAVAQPRRFDFFSRQRGKTTSEEGLPLGSLKTTQSQSMPRETADGLQSIQSNRAPQRYTIGLFGQMSNAVWRRNPPLTTSATESSAVGYEGSDPLNIVESSGLPFAVPRLNRRTPASRPTSTYSAENALPLPSPDSPRFGWGASRESLHRPSGTRGGQAPQSLWSGLSSRRQSVQEDFPPTHISEIGDAEEDDDTMSIEANSKLPDPIGTKPANSSPSKALNPNARDFMSGMFSFGKRGEKTEKAKPKSKKKEKIPFADDGAASMTDDSSPPDSRKSKETPRNSGAESLEELFEERGESTSSTPQENTPISTPGRESLIKMLSRKSSSNKITLSSFKDKGGLFSRKANQAEENEDDSSSSAKLGRSADSTTSTPLAASEKRNSHFSLASLKRRNKKGNEAPSISETSITSEMGDEEEERPSVDEGF